MKLAMAFEQELMALLPRLRRFARGLAQHAADADDLVQAALERALQSRTQWQGSTGLDGWMYRIMRNLWIDQRRAAQRRGGVHASLDDDAVLTIAGDGADQVEAGVARRDIAAALARLPDEQREAVLLVLVEGFAYREAAAILDVPIGTLTSRLARGREALMQQLGPLA